MSNYLRNGFICLDMQTRIDPPEEDDYDKDGYIARVKKSVITEITELLYATGRVDNQNRLFNDLWNREKKASTAIGHGIAVPHIRSKKVRDCMLGFCRSIEGYEFDAPDGERVHFFIVVVGSAFEPERYIKVYKEIANMFRFDGVRAALHETWSESDVYRIFDGNF